MGENKTCAIIISYFPDTKFRERINKFSEQFDSIVVVSNDNIKKKFDNNNIYYINNAENIGLSAAINQGIKFTIEKNYKWIGIFDQDTLISDDYIETVINIYSNYDQRDKIGFISPNYQSMDGKKIAYKTDEEYLELTNAITSGSFMPVSLINKIGLMNEIFFIEGIDTEFGLRVRKAGLKIIGTQKILLTHAIGEGVTRNFFGRIVFISNHSPARIYLQIRNLTWIIKNYYGVDYKWAWKSFFSILKRIILILLYEKNKIRKINSIIKGFLVGIFFDLKKDNIKIIKKYI